MHVLSFLFCLPPHNGGGGGSTFSNMFNDVTITTMVAYEPQRYVHATNAHFGCVVQLTCI